jgi:hypothetical protein
VLELRSLRNALAAAGVAALFAGGATPVLSSATAAAPAGSDSCSTDAAVARVRDKNHAEPKLVPDNQANAYGALRDRPLLPFGSVHIPVSFNLISDHTLTGAEQTRWEGLIEAQMEVLNDSFSGQTSSIASDTSFRFELQPIHWVVNAEWYKVVPGKVERDMKKALYKGDSKTLNVYAADIGAGLLGWAYFPKGYNHGRDFIDGVVMLDESMPGGTAGKYSGGDTLTHETGHWLMLHHTFQGGCSASGDFVTDTPKEKTPAFDCPVGRNTCAAPLDDPIHNFMDYSHDACMNMFTRGQAERMSDAWRAFR